MYNMSFTPLALKSSPFTFSKVSKLATSKASLRHFSLNYQELQLLIQSECHREMLAKCFHPPETPKIDQLSEKPLG